MQTSPMITDSLFAWSKLFKPFDYNFDLRLSPAKSKRKANSPKKIYGPSLHWRLMKRTIITKKLMSFASKMTPPCITKMPLRLTGLVNEKRANYESTAPLTRINIYLPQFCTPK